ncbi:MAG TPA: hypothetical protein DIS85_07365 [Vagococcus sp.]|uniref:Uncharacterized protein n=1 Tax=Vagococcus fluvialis bH819 TaxID=1255619 RepID=A0A1X6WPQ0_9ENTE|nr:hypothetical protein FM121_08990 [Vagococcus fluvialis bH819]HCM89696.1 hypothetical protein [Vagococcus sp.]
MAVLTESDVRNRLKKERLTEMIITKGTIVTPSAKSFLNDKGISVVFESEEIKIDESVERESAKKIEVKETDIVNEPSFILKKNRIQWSLLKVEFIKFQQNLTEEKAVDFQDSLSLILKIIDDVILGIGQTNWINTGYLSCEEQTKELEVSVEMSDYQLDLYRLMLLCEDACCELVESYRDRFGICTREDLLELEVKFPLFIKSLI